MGIIRRQGGSNLLWYRLNPDTPFVGLPVTGSNCREPYGIIRNYDDPNVRARTIDLLQSYADNNQCVIRTGIFSSTELGNGGTIHNIANGLNSTELNKVENFLSDIRSEGFDLHFSYFPIANDRPFVWSSWQQQRFNAHLALIMQIRPVIQSIFPAGSYHHELGNEQQGASNQPLMVRYSWEMYRAYGNLYGISDTSGMSVGYSSQSAGLSRYNIQFADYQDQNKGLHGLPQYLDLHSYDPIINTNALLQIDQEMTNNGDTRDIILGETYYSSYTSHVNSVLSQVSQMNRDVVYVAQWPIDQTRGCDGHVNRGSTELFNYHGAASCRNATDISCGNSVWS